MLEDGAMSGSQFSSWVGALAVVAGILLVAFQLLRPRKGKPHSRGLGGSVGPIHLRLQTTFPGLLVIGLGVILVAIGALTSK